METSLSTEGRSHTISTTYKEVELVKITYESILDQWSLLKNVDAKEAPPSINGVHISAKSIFSRINIILLPKHTWSVS